LTDGIWIELRVITIFLKKEINGFVPVPIHGNQDLEKGAFLAMLKKLGLDK